MRNLYKGEQFIHTKYGWCFYTLDYVNYPIIYGLNVEKMYRRQGNATHLLALVINEIRESGYQGPIYIHAQPKENSITVEDLTIFYKKMGLTIF